MAITKVFAFLIVQAINTVFTLCDIVLLSVKHYIMIVVRVSIF